METRYKPFGEVRYATPDQTLATRHTFTGQYSYVADDATDHPLGVGLTPFACTAPQAQAGRQPAAPFGAASRGRDGLHLCSRWDTGTVCAHTCPRRRPPQIPQGIWGSRHMRRAVRRDRHEYQDGGVFPRFS